MLTRSAAAEAGSDLQALVQQWEAKHQELLKVDQHYSKKENILFPLPGTLRYQRAAHGDGGKHDEVRAALKEVTKVIEQAKQRLQRLNWLLKSGAIVLPALNDVAEMIHKEENILFPPSPWKPSLEMNGAKSRPSSKTRWPPVYKGREEADSAEVGTSGGIDLEVGVLTPEQLNLLFSHLPVDITFVDDKDEVAFFSPRPRPHL